MKVAAYFGLCNENRFNKKINMKMCKIHKNIDILR